jgi:hypothetical protein
MGVPAGPWYIDDLLTFTVNTHRVDTGVGTDADGVPTYRVYEDETGTAILTGSTAKLDDASTVGFYSEQLTLSAANGFEVGKSYSIYVSATVNSVVATQSFNFKVIAATYSDDAVLAAIDALPTANENADALLDRANGIETGLTPRQALRLSAAADGGKLSGAATATNTIRNAVADDKDRIVATVDADGNRTAITYDLA